MAKRKAKKEARLDPYIAAQIDPFDPEVSGVKIPDDNMLPSATNRFRGVFSAVTDANGNYASIFRPYAFGAQFLPLSISSTPVVNWLGGMPLNLNCATAMATTYNEVRTVAAGLRIKFIGSRTTSQGKLHIASYGQCYTQEGHGVYFAPTTPAQFENCPWYGNYSLNEICEQEIVVPIRRTDCGSHRYRALTTVPSSAIAVPSGAIETCDGWSAIAILIEGANASTAVAQVEVVYHFEGLLRGDAGSFIAPSPARDYKVSTLEQASRVTSRMPIASYVEDGLNTARKVITTISQGVSTASRIAEMAGPLLAML